jgi:glycosyltransferase involved in cell wall biosynthesis
MNAAGGEVRPLHILLVADRDWTHPQGGGSGANLYAQVAHWIEWGHKVTVVAGTYPGAVPFEQITPRLAVHRMGDRLTVFPKTIGRVRRGLGADADVVLEVINGIAYNTPLWLRSKPRAVLVHHVHDDLYIGEFGPVAGRLLHWGLEALPLRLLYKRTRFITISQAAKRELVRLGIPERNIAVEYLGVERGAYQRGERAPEPRLLYLGRLKAYKRIEHTLDVLEAIPEAHLDIVGEGDHHVALEAEIERRGLAERVTMHGWVDDETKAELYGRAWVALTASSSEGWSLTVMEGALCGTPSAALAVGGLSESIVDGETGILASTPEELISRVREVIADPALRERLGDQAEARARSFSWDRSAAATLRVLAECAGRPVAVELGAVRSDSARVPA